MADFRFNMMIGTQKPGHTVGEFQHKTNTPVPIGGAISLV